MGRVITKIKVENLGDILLAERNQQKENNIRSIETEALVDTGATLLCLPISKISELGLSIIGKKEAMTANGKVESNVYGGARLTIMDRSCTVDVMELPEGTPALVGYVPLEILDFKIDLQSQTLGTNPEHGGKWVMDLF